MTDVFTAMDAAGWEYVADRAVFTKDGAWVTFAQAAEALRLAEAGVDRSVFAMFEAANDE